MAIGGSRETAVPIVEHRMQVIAHLDKIGDAQLQLVELFVQQPADLAAGRAAFIADPEEPGQFRK